MDVLVQEFANVGLTLLCFVVGVLVVGDLDGNKVKTGSSFSLSYSVIGDVVGSVVGDVVGIVTFVVKL